MREWKRKSFGRVLASPWGIFMLLLTPCTGGLIILVLLYMHFGEMPRRVWLTDGRIFSDKSLPKEGVPTHAVRLELTQQALLFFSVNRYLRIYFTDERDKERFLNLNEVYYESAAIDEICRRLG